MSRARYCTRHPARTRHQPRNWLMHTEPTPVQPLKPPPLSETPDPPVAEELENVTIRVVRLEQLGRGPEPLPAPAAPQSDPPRGTSARGAESLPVAPTSSAPAA